MLTGVVFVIDCHDIERISLAKEELLNLASKLGHYSSIPIVIAANKQDLSRSFISKYKSINLSFI